MQSTARHGAIALASLLAVPWVAGPAPQDMTVQMVDPQTAIYTLDFGADGKPLADLVDLAQGLLHVPIDYQPGDFAGLRVFVIGPQQIHQDRLRDWFDALLALYGFWTWDDTSTGTTRIVVRQPPKGRGWELAQGPTPPTVDIEALAAGHVPRAPVYNVVFPLRHLRCRELLGLLSNMLTFTYESVRCPEGSTAAVITGTRPHLLAIRDLLAAIDVPPQATVPEPDLAHRLAAIEARLDTIEARLSK